MCGFGSAYPFFYVSLDPTTWHQVQNLSCSEFKGSCSTKELVVKGRDEQLEAAVKALLEQSSWVECF